MLTDLQTLVERGHIVTRDHPTLPLRLYNYHWSAPVSYRKPEDWPDTLREARGLVLDHRGTVVGRPFKKFFNLQEYRELPEGKVTLISEKMDGSLIIAFGYQGHLVVHTRGSFTSDQSEWALDLLVHKYPKMAEHIRTCRGLTFMFELIHPNNQIVVNYGDRKELVYLGARDIAGYDLPSPALDGFFMGVPLAKSYNSNTPFEELISHDRPNHEGYVVLLDTGERIKFKHAQYCRLHKIMTGLSPRLVWEWVSTGTDWRGSLQGFPDETFDWVERTANDLQDQHDRIHAVAHEEANKYFVEGDRKATAMAYKANATVPYNLLFNALDGKDVSPVIWNMLKPEAAE